MRINIRNDSVVIEGYVNAIERNSKPLPSRTGTFIERICKGAFLNSLKRNNHVRALLNHMQNRQIGITDDGSLELEEDNIGLRARLETSDPEVMEDARNGNLVGWSFGFRDVPNGVETRSEDGMPLRLVRDMELSEVSLLNKNRVPAYDGTLVMVRAEGEVEYYGDDFESSIEVNDETVTRDTETISEQAEKSDEIQVDYSKYENLIRDMREE